MKILIAGAGKGSFQIRAVQLGAAMGARVTSSPTDEDFAWADVVVLVKKHGARFAPQVHRAGKPLVWDALDFWSQPAQNTVSEAAARQLLRAQIAAIRPTLTIGATRAMAEACSGVYLPHHARPGLWPAPPRDDVSVVAYEGNALYLGRWHGWLVEACAARGWQFVINPPSLHEADLLVSFRDGPWDGWICREWKSGVKVVNAIAAGRPLLSQPSAALRELSASEVGIAGQVTQAYGTTIEDPAQLGAHLDDLEQWHHRAAAYRCSRSLAPALTLEVIAAQYVSLLASVVEAPCTA